MRILETDHSITLGSPQGIDIGIRSLEEKSDRMEGFGLGETGFSRDRERCREEADRKICPSHASLMKMFSSSPSVYTARLEGKRLATAS